MKNPVFAVIAKLETYCDSLSQHDRGADARNHLAHRLMEIAESIREGEHDCMSVAFVMDDSKLNPRKSRDELPTWADVVTLERFDLTPSTYRESKVMISPNESTGKDHYHCGQRVINMAEHLDKLTEAFLDGVEDHPDLKQTTSETITTVSKASI